ncbi:hypothetical protein C8R45DRAFT_1032495 [Mycena sanguinolenta]|nr:hypothetical protein C8R45DRAFT_1032495 [Mycena sanguinolenta]
MTTPKMPATNHTLSDAHRRRLVRTTRKVGALLGEIPIVAGTSQSTSMPRARSGHSRSVSTMDVQTNRVPLRRTSSFKPIGNSRVESSTVPTIVRPTLFLSIPTPGTSTPAESTTPLPSPLTPTFSISSNSSSALGPNVDATRRRNMAKLVRTLGENIPPEYVVAAPRPALRRRVSVPESILKHKLSLDLATEEPLDVILLNELVPRLPAVPLVSVDTPSPTITSFSSDDCLLPKGRSRTLSSTYRQENGWSGEWGGNVSNMEDVRRNLRGLKLK